jgi:hypothetical protein
MEARGGANLSSGYKGNGTEGTPTTSAPKSSFGPPLGANIKTWSPFWLKHSTVFVSIVTIPSILGKNDSVMRAILILANSLTTLYAVLLRTLTLQRNTAN